MTMCECVCVVYMYVSVWVGVAGEVRNRSISECIGINLYLSISDQ